MAEAKQFELPVEHCSVETTIEFVLTSGSRPVHFRIEVLLSHLGTYSTRTYRQQVVAPLSEDGQKRIVTKMWTDFDLPQTSGETADEAVKQALEFLMRDLDLRR